MLYLSLMPNADTYFMMRRVDSVIFIREVESTNNSAIRLTKRQAFELAKYSARPCKRAQNPKIQVAAAKFIFTGLDNESKELPADKFLPARGEEFPPAPAWWKAENLNPETGYYEDRPQPRRWNNPPVTEPQETHAPVNADILKALVS